MTIVKLVDDDSDDINQAGKQEHDKKMMTATDEQHKNSRNLCEKPPDVGKELKADIRQYKRKHKATLLKVDNKSNDTSIFTKFMVKKLLEDVRRVAK